MQYRDDGYNKKHGSKNKYDFTFMFLSVYSQAAQRKGKDATAVKSEYGLTWTVSVTNTYVRARNSLSMAMMFQFRIVYMKSF